MKRHGAPLLLLPALLMLCVGSACAQVVSVSDATHGYANVNGVRLHYVTAGQGKPIFFLHGFPEFWYQWKPQIAGLAGTYRVIAPDMRGYNLSTMPVHVSDYEARILVEDVRALADHLGLQKFTLVGHDWGGAIAWAFALYHPEYLERLIILNAPHPIVFDREMRDNSEQQKASQYMLMFRTPQAEQIMADKNFAIADGVLLTPGVKAGYLTEADRQAYLDVWSRRGLTGGLNYYRATRIGPPREDGSGANGNFLPEVTSYVVRVPTLVIWGMKDPYLLTGNLKGLEKFVPNLTIKEVPDADHWVNHEQPDVVNGYIRAFIEQGS
jgi:pimeloyl-ACP methyl ester carboxylesterase